MSRMSWVRSRILRLVASAMWRACEGDSSASKTTIVAISCIERRTTSSSLPLPMR